MVNVSVPRESDSDVHLFMRFREHFVVTSALRRSYPGPLKHQRWLLR